MYTINMYSKADTVEGHGVLSAYQEMTALLKQGLGGEFEITEKTRPGDINHYHTVNPSFFLGLPFAHLRGATVGYVHFLPETVDQSLKLPKVIRAVFYRYLMTFYKSMDKLVTVNPCFIDKLMEYGIPRERIAYIPNFVSNDEFYPADKEEKAQIREKLGLDSRFTVICAGQLQTRKGVLEFADVARRMPQLSFVWVGGFSFGQMTDGYAQISELLDNPPENLKFTGMVHRDQMRDYYSACDVMFLPSYGELFPMTVLEAMACGLPLLLRDIDIYPRILFDYYQKADTQQGFVEILERLSTDDAYYEKAASDSRRGNAFYNKDHVLEMWREFYSSLVPFVPGSVAPNRQ